MTYGTVQANAIQGSINTFSPNSAVFRNRIINGDMRIDQRNAGSAVTTDGAYPVDRFIAFEDTDGAYSAQRDTTAPAGFINSLKWTTTTADSSLGSSQYAGISQSIEGFNVADLNWGTANAKTVTLSFWVRSSLTGTFGGSFRNSANNRSYPFTYSISVADTWEFKTITVTGDTSGTWLTDNGAGLKIFFGLGVGSSLSGTAGAWSGSNFLSATSAVSVIGTLNATWFITGVQLEVGSTATSFDYRPYGTEFALCQRYYFRNSTTNAYTAYLQGSADSTTSVFLSEQLPVRMRANPTFAQSGMDLYGQPSGGVSIGAITNRSNQNTASILIATTGASTGTGYRLESSSGSGLNGYVEYSAEL